MIDDLTASGTTLLRRNPKNKREWIGKLKKLRNAINNAEESGIKIFEDGWSLYVHHYIGNQKAIENINKNSSDADKELNGKEWFGKISYTFGMIIPEYVAFNVESDRKINDLVEKYYDYDLDEESKEHLKQSGIESLKHGYGACGLPLILDHNTPNNSLPLLWAESKGKNGAHKMRPLFKRRQRHGKGMVD